MVDIDNLITCWYPNIPYLWIPRKNIDECQRRYFIHENCIVYHKNKPIELYKVFSENYNLNNVYIYPKKNKDFPHNLFKIMNPYQINDKGEYRINGEKIDIPNNLSLYLYLWKTFGFSKIKSIEIKKPDNDNTNISFLKKEISPYSFDINPINSETDLFGGYDIEFDTSKINRKIDAPQRDYEDFIFYLNHDFPRKVYEGSVLPKDPIYHIGQLKLLITEIFFFTQKLVNIDDYGICVYIGSAGGFHIPILANMFPNILFMLYDGAKHYINPSHNIIIHQELFLENNVEMFKDLDVYFISDIRVADKEHFKFEQNVHSDNMLNRHIVMNLNPKESLLKFRFPYEVDNIEQITHLNGKFLLQTFAPLKSAETRLIPYNNRDLIEGNNITYEEQMMYFNTEYRNHSFEDLDPLFGLNYDFYSFYKTIEMFLERKKTTNIKNKIIIFLKTLEKVKSIGRPKSLNNKSLLEILYGYSPKLILHENQN